MSENNGRRNLIKGLFIAALLGLSACGNGTGDAVISQVSFSDDDPIVSDPNNSKKSNLDLNADGTPKIQDLMKAGPLGEKSIGSDTAPVTIIEYASLTCPYCRAFHLQTWPTLKRDYIDTGKVRFILREFPIGHASGAATIAMRCLGQDNTTRFFDLYHKFITQQKKWVSLEVRRDKIFSIAAQTGVSRKQFDACFTNQEILEGLKWVKQRGRDLGVSGTPTFFINGKKARSVLTIEEIKKLAAPSLS